METNTRARELARKIDPIILDAAQKEVDYCKGDAVDLTATFAQELLKVKHALETYAQQAEVFGELVEALEKIASPTYCSGLKGLYDGDDVIRHMRAIAKTALVRAEKLTGG